MKKINATGNPGCILFNSEWAISAGNTLRIGADGEHGGMCPQPQSGWVMGIAEIRGEKIGGGVGYRIILAKQITLKYVF